MSLWTRSRQLPNTDNTISKEGPAADGSPESTPDGSSKPVREITTPDQDTASDQDAAANQNPAVNQATAATRDDTAAGEKATAGDAAGDAPGKSATDTGRRGKHPAVAKAATRTATALSAVLVLFALLLPDNLSHLTPFAFTRLPIEGIFGTALLLVLPQKARRAAALLLGVGLSLLTIVKFLDMGFYSTLVRPFDLVLDWGLLGDAVSFLKESAGQTGAIGAVIGAVVLVLALLVLMPLAVVRLSRLMVRHSATATRTTLILVTVWVALTALGVRIGGMPVASMSDAHLVHNRAHQVRAGLRDERVFARKAAADRFRGTPADRLLTGLRGKDVIFTFIESYGRSAIQDPGMGPQVDAVLEKGTKRLRAAGFSSRSAFLTSPVSGAGSWLAHSTFLSGLWIKNQQRYRNLTSSDRLTLTRDFRRTKAWRTVGVVPGVRRAWPEGRFFGLDHIYDSRHLGYKGPYFSWTPVPDQFSLAAFERLEHGKRGHKPMMAEIILASSHNPWAPIPKMIGWDKVGDGSIYRAIEKEGKDPEEVWKDPEQVRTEYRQAIQYSLNSLISYVEKYGDDNTVLVFLGDHQPVPTVTEGRLGRDVPIAIVAHDPAVMKRISGWGWQEGLKPGPRAPVWRMDTFRDRFLTAYGPRPDARPSSPAR